MTNIYNSDPDRLLIVLSIDVKPMPMPCHVNVMPYTTNAAGCQIGRKVKRQQVKEAKCEMTLAATWKDANGPDSGMKARRQAD